MAVSKINFDIQQDDLKALFIACGGCRRKQSFNMWVHNTEANYEEYFLKFTELKREVKTFSEWVNGQTVAMTTNF